MTNSLTLSRLRKITHRFGLEPLNFTSIASYYRKNAVIQVLTDAGTYALKPFIRSTLLRSNAVQQIKIASHYVRLLMDSGYTYMPKWLSTSSGAIWILNQESPFYIAEWIKGRNLETAEDYEKLGRALAALHTTCNALPAGKSSATLKQIRLWQFQDRLFRKRMARAIKSKDRFYGWYKKYGKACNRLSDRAWADFRKPTIVNLLKKEKEHPALIHRDITSFNVIISDDGQLFIIDWDRVNVGSIYVDLATALMNTTQFNPEFIQSLLTGYEELKPLSRSERRLVTTVYGIPREAWHGTRFPNRTRSGKMLGILDQSWLLRLQAMEFMDEWANQ
jgi:Ser/Thr protein kinase RdoA (MazF antagonist)